MTDEPLKPAPFDLDAEENVIGAMLISQPAIDAAVDAGLDVTDFYRPSHGLIFDAIRALYLDDLPADAITVSDRLDATGALEKIGGKERIHEIAGIVPATRNAGHYATIVRELAVLRQLILAGSELQRLGRERPGEIGEIVEEAERLVFDLALSRRSGDFVPLTETLAAAFRRLEELHTIGHDIVGVPTGFRPLDRITSGLQPGNLIVIAARPSMGKSALALGLIANVAIRAQLPVGLFSLEMSKAEVTQRLLSSEGMVDSAKIRNGKLSGEEWAQLTAAGARLHNATVHIDDSGTLTAMEIRSKARRLKVRHPDLAMIVVDYLQLMTSGSGIENRVQDVSQISRSLKALARELDIPVVALSQLSRQPEQRHDKRPMLSDLRESGSIEQDSDLVMFIYRDDYYNPEDAVADKTEGIAEVNLAKHRNGETGTIKLAFVKRYTKFGDIEGSAWS